MKKLLILLATLLLGWDSATSWAQGETSPPTVQAREENRKRSSDLQERNESWTKGDTFRSDLWYGTPQVRAGGDLLRPLISLLRRPSSLLDFTPRQVPWVSPDRETTSFIRER